MWDRWGLAGLSAIESIFFPIPPDPALAALVVREPPAWWRLALITTAASLVGAVIGYFVAYFFFDALAQPLVQLYHLEARVATVQHFFEESVFLFTLVAAVTPIPYKVFVLTAGFMKVSLTPFLIASLIGRGARFYAVAYLSAHYGERGLALVRRYSVHLTIIGLALIAVYILRMLFF